MSRVDLKAVAHLARLHLAGDELKFLETQVSQILSFVEKLNELKDLENAEPTSHPLALSNVFREDTPSAGISIEEFLKHSPRSKGRFFEVPKIIDAGAGSPRPESAGAETAYLP